MQRQRGFTTAELAAAVSIGLMGVAAVAATISDRMNQGRITGSVDQARVIATEAEFSRKQVESSAIVGNRYQYTYRDFVDWQPVAVMTAQTGRAFPTTTPWGTAYEFRASDDISEVRFIVPFQLNNPPPETVVTPLPGGRTLVSVFAQHVEAPGRSDRGHMIKRTLYLENTR